MHQSIISSIMFIICAAPLLSHAVVLESQGIKVEVGGKSITSITVDGMPFSEKSEMYVVKPQWAGTYYSFAADKALRNTVSFTKEGSTQTAVFLTHDKETGVLNGKQTVQLLSDRTVRLSAEARNTSSCQAIFEQTVCDLVPTWFAGRPVTLTLKNGKTVKERFPFSMITNDRKQCIVGSDIRKAVVDTRVGPVEFTVSGNTPLTMLDYRMNPFLEGKSQIWFGVLSYDFPPESNCHWAIDIKFPPPYVFPKSEKVTAETEMPKSEQTLRPEKLKDIVIPTPKKVSWKRNNLILSDNSSISYDHDEVKEILITCLENLPKGLSLKVTDAKSTPNAAIQARLNSNKSMKPEGYTISVNDKTAVLEAQTTVGLLHATRTLTQLLRLEENGTSWSVRQCEVQDWPVMPVRGVEFYTGHNAGDAQARVVRKLMGQMKMNMLIHHICYAEWKARPDLFNAEMGMTKSELKKVVEECRKQAVEYVPFFPAYGLIEWFRHEVVHPKSKKPESSVWNDPDEQEGLRAIFEECIQELNPQYIHIGHDELYSAPDVDLLASIIKWHGWLKERGIKTMIWSDLFLSKGDAPDACNAKSPEIAQKRRDMLPKDIIVTDWHYEPGTPDSYKSLQRFNDSGLDTIASSWFNPQNVVCFGKAAAEQLPDAPKYKKTNPDGSKRGATLGQIATTWAGWNFNRKAMDENGRQLADYILTAESAWVGGYNSEKDIPFNVLPVFYRLWNDEVLPIGNANGWSVDLSKIANFPLSAKDNAEWLGFPKGENLSSLPTGTQWFERFMFEIPKNQCVLLSGKLGDTTGYESVRMPVDKQADAVVFAVGATLPFPIDIPIAHTVVNYEDGTTETISWRVANNVFSIDDGRSSGASPIIWTGKTSSKRPVYLHALVWNNPKPQLKVASFQTTSANQASSLMIFGISGIQGSK